MLAKREEGAEQPGIHWGPFTLRIPFVHSGYAGPEFFQGILVSAATGLALVPLMTSAAFGLTFEEAVIMSLFSAILISSGPIIFGEPFAPGWITPALPLVLAFVLAPDRFPTPTEKFQAMFAMSFDLAIILLVLGVTGLGRKLIEWIPAALKGAIIMGAAIAAFKRVFIDDAAENLFVMPVSMTIVMGLCLILSFSLPIQKYKGQMPWLQKIASLGLLPGFVIAGIVGTIIGELSYSNEAGESIIQWGILIPPFGALFAKVSPFAIGFPIEMLFNPDVLILAFVAYIILFGDIVTGIEVLKTAIPKRPDEKVAFDATRTHLSTGIRNLIMSLFAPFFPTQGSLWTGVHVIIVNRWAEGRKGMDSLHSGIASYYFFGLPVLYLALPVVTGLRPLMPIALALTLVLTGFACAYVAMEIPRNATERGVVLLGGAALAFFSPLHRHGRRSRRRVHSSRLQRRPARTRVRSSRDRVDHQLSTRRIQRGTLSVHWRNACAIGITVVWLCTVSVAADDFRAVFWNLESGDSNDRYIAHQMIAKENIDFWGLSEVSNQGALNTIEKALEKAHDVDYITKLSRDGGGDRLAILFRSDIFEAVRYTGKARVDHLGGHFFEVDTVNVGGTIRPGLAVQLRTQESGEEFIAMVNHWKCCGDDDDKERRKEQAVQINAFASASAPMPIIAGGDFNIPLNRGGMDDDAFKQLIKVWKYRQPINIVGSHRGGSLLDAVFVANTVAGWKSEVTIIERADHRIATTNSFDDDDKETDHRPILLVVQSEKESGIDDLRERIKATRATLKRLEAELKRRLNHE